MRLLDLAQIPYHVRTFTVEGDNFHGIQVAVQFEMDPDTVYKTLVTQGDKTGVTVFCIPINCELNLKKAALASGNKKIEMLAMKDILPTTGYIRGGCSPIGMKKKYPTYFDETATLFDEIGVSAGARGCEVILHPETLAAFVSGKFVDLT